MAQPALLEAAPAPTTVPAGQEAAPAACAGLLDLRGGAAVLRTDGYLPSRADVTVPAALVRRHDLRRGDLLTGTATAAGRRQHPDPRTTMTTVDSINGTDPAQARNRPRFEAMVPLHPWQRLHLETGPTALTARMVDLFMPLGKGQRALIPAPPRAGKTMVLRAVADALASNHPECHLMMLLVDERPEEVTDARRAVRGEVVASTFDRPPTDHTAVAELAVARARRLAETGSDVVLLLDSLTRLARAYSTSAPASGRVLSGGIAATALYPAKQLLGAARALEGGGSLTIVATAMVENGSVGDTLIFEELKSTGNAELKLDRRLAEKRLYPAVDLVPSGTRREDLLLDPAERVVVGRLRAALATLEPDVALAQVLEPLRRTASNAEFLTLVASQAPGTAPGTAPRRTQRLPR